MLAVVNNQLELWQASLRKFQFAFFWFDYKTLDVTYRLRRQVETLFGKRKMGCGVSSTTATVLHTPEGRTIRINGKLMKHKSANQCSIL